MPWMLWRASRLFSRSLARSLSSLLSACFTASFVHQQHAALFPARTIHSWRFLQWRCCYLYSDAHLRNFQTKQNLYSTKSWPTLSSPPSKSIAITPLHESPPSPPGPPLSSCTSFVAQVCSSVFICSQFFFFFPSVFYPIAPSPEDVGEGRVWILKFFFALFFRLFFLLFCLFVFSLVFCWR